MKTLAKQYYSIEKLCALLVVQLVALGSADYQDQHHPAVQTRNYEHPRFGDGSIRSCTFNQYLDEEEGRCLIVPGGGRAISIDPATTCRNEALRGHPSNPRIYYVCRETKTILAECDSGKYFDNRLKRCATDVRERMDEGRDTDHGDTYDHVDLPACVRPGSFAVPGKDCSVYYSCKSNGFRLFRTMHECPTSTGFDPYAEKCTAESACRNEETMSTRSPKKRPETLATTKTVSTTAPTTKIISTTAPTTLPPRPIVTVSTRAPKNPAETPETTTTFSATTATTASPRTVTESTKASETRASPINSTAATATTVLPQTIAVSTRADNRPELLVSTSFTGRMPTTAFPRTASTAPDNRTEVLEATKLIPTSTTSPPAAVTESTRPPNTNGTEVLEPTKLIPTSTTSPPAAVTESTRPPNNRTEVLEPTKLIPTSTTSPPVAVTESTRLPNTNGTEVLEPTQLIPTSTTSPPATVPESTRASTNRTEFLNSTKHISTSTPLPLIVTVSSRAPDNRSDVLESTKIIGTTTAGTSPTIISTTAAPINRPEVFGSTNIPTASSPSVTKVSSIDMNKDKTLSSTTPKYDAVKTTIDIELNPDSSVTEKIAAPTRPPTDVDNIIDSAETVTERSTTKQYERKAATTPSKSTINIEAFDKSSQTEIEDYSPTTKATNEIVEIPKAIYTSAGPSDYESTAKPSATIESLLYSTYSDDYVTLRSDNGALHGTTSANYADSDSTISNKYDESTTGDPIDALSWTSERDDSFTEATMEISSNQNVETTTSQPTVADLWRTDEDNSTDSTVTMDPIKVDETTIQASLEDLRTTETDESFSDSTTMVSSDNNEEATSQSTIEDSSWTSKQYEPITEETITMTSDLTDEATTSPTTIEDPSWTSEQYETITDKTITTTSDKIDEATSSTTMEDSWTSEQENSTPATITMSSNPEDMITGQETTEKSSWISESENTKETTAFDIELQDSYTTESSTYNASEEYLFHTTPDSSSTTLDEVSSTSNEGLSTPLSRLDASELDTRSTEIQATTPSGLSSSESSTLANDLETNFSPEAETKIDVAVTTSANDHFSTEEEYSMSSSNSETYTSYPNPIYPASSTPRYEDNEEVTVEEAFSTNDVEFTTLGPNDVTISMSSSDFPKNEELRTSEESITSTTEAEIIPDGYSTVPADSFMSTQQNEELRNENTDPAFNDTRTSAAFLTETTENLQREIDLVGTTRSTLPVSTSSDFELEDSPMKGANTVSSASNIEEPTTVASVDSANSFSTTIPPDFTSGEYSRISTDATTEYS